MGRMAVVSEPQVERLSDADFKAELTPIIPDLRAFGRSLCGNATFADDLVQESMLKAWNARARFRAGTNIKAWTFTIMRNAFYSDARRSWRQQALDPEVAEATLVANDDPDSAMELLSVQNALLALPEDQREALILVTAGGMAYEEVAEICGVAVGTIKSRVSRARNALLDLMDGDAARLNGRSTSTAGSVLDDLVQEAEDIAVAKTTS